MFTSKVWTDNNKLLQELNLTARQPRRVPHHVLQATTSEGLAQGPYVAAKMGFEPATLRMQGTELTTEPLTKWTETKVTNESHELDTKLAQQL